MEPVLKVVAGVVLLHNPVKNDKRAFILFASVLTQYSRASIQPGFLSSLAEKGFHQGKWEHIFDLVGHKNPAALQPSSTGFPHPWCNSTPYRLEKHTVRCTVAQQLAVQRLGVAVADDTPLPHFKYHVVVTIICHQRVFRLYQSWTEKTIDREMLTPWKDNFSPQSQQKPSFFWSGMCLVFSVIMWSSCRGKTSFRRQTASVTTQPVYISATSSRQRLLV